MERANAIGRLALVLAGALLCVGPEACNGAKDRSYTIGVINVVPDFDQILAGFKEGMAAQGYLEGKNIRYLYGGATTNLEMLPGVAQGLVASRVDLILSMTTPATLAARKATAGTGLHVVFAGVTDPVGAGVVESLRHPGGNITGVVFGSQEQRRLEWLMRIAPGIRRIYVPFNPRDRSPVLSLKAVEGAAAKLGVELMTREVSDEEALQEAIVNLPPTADAVFLLPDSLVSTRLPDLVKAATARRLPVSGANVSAVRGSEVLTSFGFDQQLSGKQAARLANQIFKGTSPADLPVEVVEFFLAVNLKVAQAIGLAIPDEILRQADIIVR
jgi:putative tryptophan/tyrosine transport system substrate-binding protein